MSTELQFVEIGADGVEIGDEVLVDGAWVQRLDRLLAPRRGRALLAGLAAVVTIATFGGTAVDRGRLTATPTTTAAAVDAPPSPAVAPADVNVCSFEWDYVEDPNQPGVRPYEVLFCPSPRPPSTRGAGHPIPTK